MTKNIKHILFTFIILIATFTVFEVSELDLLAQDLLYNFDQKHWLIIKEEHTIAHFIFYDGIKKLLIFFELFLLLSLIFFRKKQWVKLHLAGLIIMSIALPTVPLVVSAIKGISNVACPYKLIRYDGNIEYTAVLNAYPEETKPLESQRCFPAAHASTGFALLSLFFIATTSVQRTISIILGLSIGGFMGSYKMLIGHHFLSHTLISMLLAWLLTNIIAYGVSSIFRKVKL